METIIKVNNLKKVFKVEVKKHWFFQKFKSLFKWEYTYINAVENVSFEVKEWEKVAFLWPNWAGKSTTIKMLTWILSETSGEINVLGLNPSSDREKLVYNIWAVFWQTSRLWYHLTPYDTFLLFSKLFDIHKKDFEKRLDYLIEKFEISWFMKQPVRKLSLWQRMRCEVVASLINNPKIIFLDEPTIGLDMIAKQKLRDVINEINSKEKTTIFLTSHDIGDIEEICDRVIIINYWKIIYDWTLKQLRKDHIKSKIIKIKFEDEITDFVFSDFVKIIKKQWNYLELEVINDNSQLQEIFNILNNNYKYEDISISEPSMEEIIKTFY